MIDTDNSGTITFDELKEGLRRVGSELMESEIKDLMNAVRTLFIIPSMYLSIYLFSYLVLKFTLAMYSYLYMESL